MVEEWRDVKGYPGYQISSLGRLRSFLKSNNLGLDPDGRILKGGVNKDGYRRAVLCRKGGRKSLLFCQMVADAFLGPKPSGQVIRHMDGTVTNDSAPNLKYGTQKENIYDKKEHGTWQSGEKHPRSILNEDQVRAIKFGTEKPKLLAERFGISRATISAIRTGRLWKDVAPSRQL